MLIHKEDIFAKTNNGLDAFQYYVATDFKLGKAFSSPLREDKNPSFSIYLDKSSGRYLFKDHAQDNVKGDIVKFVMLLHNLDFKSALSRINQDMVLGLGEANSNKSIQNSGEVREKKFDGMESDYWQQYGITGKTLNNFNVVSIDFFTTQTNFQVQSSLKQPIFAYKNKWGHKIYQPFGKYRFCYVGTKPDNYIFGWNQLPDNGYIMFITGGEKDVLTLDSLGYPAICLNSETAQLDEKVAKELKSRFRYVVAMYDCDETGRQSSTSLSEKHKLINLRLPLKGTKEEKDISDFIRNGYSKETFKGLIDKAIEK
jgi:DNA primase